MKHLVQKLLNKIKFFTTSPNISSELLTLFHALRQCEDFKSVKFNKYLNQKGDIVTDAIKVKVLPMIHFDVCFLDKETFHSTAKEIFILNSDVKSNAWMLLANHLEVSFNTRINWSRVSFKSNELSFAGYLPNSDKYIVLRSK